MSQSERDLLAKLNRESRNASTKNPRPSRTGAYGRPAFTSGDRIIAGPSGGIAAASGYTASSGTCKWLKWDGDVLKDTGRTLTAYNFSNAIVLANGYRIGVASKISGKWVVISENCGDTRTYSAPSSL